MDTMLLLIKMCVHTCNQLTDTIYTCGFIYSDMDTMLLLIKMCVHTCNQLTDTIYTCGFIYSDIDTDHSVMEVYMY